MAKVRKAESQVVANPQPSFAPEAVLAPGVQQKRMAVPWKKVCKRGLRLLNRFVSLAPRVVKGDDPDAIHDMRVASRRLQQVIDLLSPSPPSPEARWLRKRIRRCRRALSPVRNCDVMLGLIHVALKRKRTSRREAWMAVRNHLLERRARSFQKGLRKLRKIDFPTFHARCREYVRSASTSVGLAAGNIGQSAAGSEQFCRRMSQRLERLWTTFESQVVESQRDPNPIAVHAVRVAAKRVRYLIEVVHAFAVAGSAQALVWLRQLQQHLGDWHDLEVLEQTMIQAVARPAFLQQNLELAMDIERLILRNRVHKKGYERKYLAMTSEEEVTQRLKERVNQVLASLYATLATPGGMPSASTSFPPSPTVRAGEG